MNAFHTISTAPYSARIKSSYKISKEDLLVMAISALKWREKNGNITLCCDSSAYNFLKKFKLLSIWNNVEINIPDDLNGINPLMFWAAGKLFALKSQTAPVVMLDTDFIVWETLHLPRDGITAAHYEYLMSGIYPELNSFLMQDGYVFPKNFIENENEFLPLNTAFLYVSSDGFKNYYLATAFDFMKSAKNTEDYLTYMVTAEQRFLSLSAHSMNIPVYTLIDKDKLFLPQNLYTHIWGAKQAIKMNSFQKDAFISSCEKRILNDFSEFEYVLKQIELAGEG